MLSLTAILYMLSVSFIQGGAPVKEEVIVTLLKVTQGRRIIVQDQHGQEREIRLESDEFLEGLNGDRPRNYTQFKPGVKLRVTLNNGVAERVEVMYPWHRHPAQWMEDRLDPLGGAVPLKALLSVLLVSVICGLVSSIVISNRMAFFSDALAHCALAGVSIGLIFTFVDWITEDGILGIMIAFGILVGLAVARVREQTTLNTDTIIGVFFAGAMGLGATALKVTSQVGLRITPETFLFGDPHGADGQQLVYLLLLSAATLAVLSLLYNHYLLASFNPSLARSRRIRVSWLNYVFIVLLALVVNICLKVVGALLINALLILPAAAAGNLARNLRQFFWWSLVLSVLAGVGGYMTSYWAEFQVRGGNRIYLGSGGVIVLAGVVLFVLSLLLGRWLRGPRSRVRAGF
jgi:zinc transport system permease protein